jgi:peptide deformylase
MAIRPLVILPDPRLKLVSEPVGEITPALRQLAQDMFDTMYDAPGIGLAAVQVGVLLRLTVIDVGKPRDGVDEDDAEEADDDEDTEDDEADDSEADDDNLKPKSKPKSKRKPDPMVMVNPQIVWLSEETNAYEEGCLSIPDYYEQVERPQRVRVRFRNLDGVEQELEADGLLATCIQHEIDHMNGVMFIDYISKLKRDRCIKKFAKAAKR